MGLEAGFDYAQVSTTDGAFKSHLFLLHLDGLVNLWESESTGYLLFGGGGLIESVQDTAGGHLDESGVGALELGLGVRRAKGRVDVRGVYTFLLDSGNVNSLFTVSLGIFF